MKYIDISLHDQLAHIVIANALQAYNIESKSEIYKLIIVLARLVLACCYCCQKVQ
jgi:hypothetical protein